jgi:hypothetical protein
MNLGVFRHAVKAFFAGLPVVFWRARVILEKGMGKAGTQEKGGKTRV